MTEKTAEQFYDKSVKGTELENQLSEHKDTILFFMRQHAANHLWHEKQSWYKKLWKKLHKIEQGEMNLPDYIKEVESKIIEK